MCGCCPARSLSRGLPCRRDLVPSAAPPPLGITKYITRSPLDGQRKGVLRDGWELHLHLNSDSPNLPSQIAASGGDRVPLHITVPGRQFGIHDVSPDGSSRC